MAYSWGQIEIITGRRPNKGKRKKKHGYIKKMRQHLKDIDFNPVRSAFRGYQ